MIEENNDETIHPPNNAPPIEIRMPTVARSYEAFNELTASSGYEAAGAVC
jgi:hypothetical protein